jgi:hypothetical protein
MNNWQRVFAFVTGAFALGLLLIILSNSYIQYVTKPGVTGYLFLFGFGLIYLNLNFGLSRRFVIKAFQMDWVPYLMAFLTILPTLFWIYTKDVGLDEAQIIFGGTAVFASFLGSYFGIRRGSIKREKYIQQLREDEQELPDELKRPHDELSKN